MIPQRVLHLAILDVVEITDDEVVLLFKREDGSIGEFPTTVREYEFLQHDPSVKPVAVETSDQRRARLVAEARDRLASGVHSVEIPTSIRPSAAPQGASRPSVQPNRHTDLALPRASPGGFVALPSRGIPEDEEDPGAEEAQRVIDRLGLKIKTLDATSTLFRVNEEATSPDGGDVKLPLAKDLVDASYNAKLPMPVRQAAMGRLTNLTLATLYKLRSVIPRDLAMHIARTRCMNLGSGPQNVGGNYIPADWTIFVEGDCETGYSDMMYAAGQEIKVSPAPVENFEVLQAIETGLPALGGGHDRKGNMGSLESRYAGMTFAGNVDLRSRD